MSSHTVSPVALVTGAASGLGLAVAHRFAQKGIRLALVDIAGGPGEHVRDEFRAQGVDCEFYYADVSQQSQASKVAKRVVDRFGNIHILVNAAGIIRRTPATAVQDNEIGQVLDVNLKGTVFMAQAVQPFMMGADGGSIVNFASMLAHYGSKNLLSYAASKGGVVQVTQCLAVEWAEYGIRVNAVSPGYIETPLSSGATKDPIFNERILSRTPQRRYGRPEEVACAVDFLASAEASFITGVVLPVDGGLLAGDPRLFPPATTLPPT